jgi:hypothetical protein
MNSQTWCRKVKVFPSERLYIVLTPLTSMVFLEELYSSFLSSTVASYDLLSFAIYLHFEIYLTLGASTDWDRSIVDG